MDDVREPRDVSVHDDLQMGHARMIEDKPLYERTIELISSNLRKIAGETADGAA